MNNSTRAVYELMRVYDGACQDVFWLNHIGRFSARIHELRKAGYKVGDRPCRSPIHTHTRRVMEYYIEEGV